MNTLKKAQFNALVELFGHDAFETVCENNHIYRQITVNGVCCRYALTKLKDDAKRQSRLLHYVRNDAKRQSAYRTIN